MMDPSHPDYAKINKELGFDAPEVRAVFTLVAEPDAEATAATGRHDPEILEPACEANGYRVVSAPVENTGYTVFRDVLYIEEHAKGERDFVAVAATDKHKQQYPNEWARFLAWQQEKRHDVRLIHGITPAAIETFRGLRIGTMEALTEFTGPLPPQFERHRDFARRYLSVVHGKKQRYRLIDGTMTPVED